MKKIQVMACLAAALLLTPAVAACGRTEAFTFSEEASQEEPLTEAPVQTEEPMKEPEEKPIEETIERPEEPEEEKPAVPFVQYLCTTAADLNVRTGAGREYASLGKAEKNVLMQYAGKADGWYETRYRGRRAYVHADYVKEVTLERAEEKVERIIEEGLNLLGTPYVYGATRFHDGKGHRLDGFTQEKFDCSSLMQYIFYRGAGVLLDVTTRTQILQGTAADKPRRGDLMFFTNASRKNKTGLERVGHVALYLGEDYILHTASDYAKVEKLTPLRKSYFLCARRML